MAPITQKTDRFTVTEYLKMDRAGVFDDVRVELVRGRIIKVHAQANPHRRCVSKINRKLQAVFPPETHWVVLQGTLILGKFGAPDPDAHVFNVPEGTEDSKLPLPFLVIEISDTTYRKDSGIKAAQYASAGVIDYWIVNIPARRVEVRRQPGRHAGASGGWGYGEVTHYVPGESAALLARTDVVIAVTELLP